MNKHSFSFMAFSFAMKILQKTYKVCRTPEEFDELINKSKELMSQGIEKDQLPVLTPHGVFENEPCTNNNGRYSGMFFIDDDTNDDPYALYNKVKGREKDLGIAYFGCSYSGKPHIWAVCPRGLDIQQSQKWLSEELGIAYDPVCKDKARRMFFTGNVLYRDDELLFKDIESPIMEGCEVPIVALDKTDNCPSAMNDEYEGLKYADIVKELVNVMGGEPMQGHRNNFLFRMVNCLRGICDNNQELLLKIVPRFGLDELEVKSIIKSATKEPVKGLWNEMKQTLGNFGVGAKEWWRIDYDTIYLYEKDIMKNLPSGLKEVLKPIPENKKMNVLCSVLPVLATYAENVQFSHATGEPGHMALMSAIIGDFGKGKSLLCKSACDLFLEPITEQDKEGWRANEDYYETQQTRSQNENAGKKPHPLIRNIATVATTPYILERMKDSQGHSLICVTAEVQDMNSNPVENVERSKILRKSFDHEEHAVGRVGKDSITGKVVAKLNTTVMGTFNAVQMFFDNGNIENGLASRFIISFLPHEVGQQWLKYSSYDEKTKEVAQQLTQKTIQ